MVKQIGKLPTLFETTLKEIGISIGNHCHIECGRARFTGTGWYKNS